MNRSWADSAVFYHIYPLGCCGAEKENNFNEAPKNRIGALKEWIPHLVKLGANAVYFGPVFESSRHGYDTADYRKIDRRLGTNEEFTSLCDALHTAGVRVVLDGVFNHVGRHFWAFQDVQKNRDRSPYRDWFSLHFDGDSPYHDGFYYECWEGNYDLVKLNLNNTELKNHLFDCVAAWMDSFRIDGLRLDVAYCMDKAFLNELASFCRMRSENFWLLGEMIHGDYSSLARPGLLQSATNYECYKGLFSSFNTKNFFEIAHSFDRQFGGHDWSLYNQLHLYNFLDNHDVPRITSQIENPYHLPLVYAMLFGMVGIPSLYYGSEWGIEGKKGSGPEADYALRPAVAPREIQWNSLTECIAVLAEVHKKSAALRDGNYAKVYLTNEQFIFERSGSGETVLVAVNLSSQGYTAHISGYGSGLDLLHEEEEADLSAGVVMRPYSASYYRVVTG